MGSEAQEVFRQQVREVRGILLLADQRKAAFEASRIAAKMPGPNQATTNDVTRATTPSDLHAWLMTVQLAAGRVGRRGTYVMYARLCRRARSAESSWEQIATEAGITIAEAKQVFHLAVPAFLAVCRAKGMTTKFAPRVEPPRAQSIQPKDAEAILAIAKQVRRAANRWKRKKSGPAAAPRS